MREAPDGGGICILIAVLHCTEETNMTLESNYISIFLKALLLALKVKFKVKTTNVKEEHNTVINRSINQNTHTILSVYALNRVCKYM